MGINRIIKRALGLVGLEVNRVVIPRRPRLSGQSLAMSAYFFRLLERVGQAEGDIVECGVGRGVSLVSWCTYVEYAQQFQDDPKWPERRIMGFDSFEGLPDPSSDDLNPGWDNNPHIRAGTVKDTSMTGVIRMLRSTGVSPDFISDQVRLVPGWFNNTLPNFDAKIALLHIDVDLHDSYLTVLNQLYNQVVPGGVIAFDEYKSDADSRRFPGAAKAIDTFFEDKPGKIEKDKFLNKWFYVMPTS